jgi:hypothetical protein
MQITLQKVSGCVVEDGERGRNVIRDMAGGVQVAVRRTLLAEPLPLPPITTAVNVPKLQASLLDSEYALILAVLAGNFGEAADLPCNIAWLHQQLLTDKMAAAPSAASSSAFDSAAASASPAGVIPEDGSDGSTPAAAGAQGVESDAAVKRQVVSDFSCTSSSLLGLLCDLTTVKITVSIGQAQLMLYNKQQQGLPPTPLGSAEFSNLWVAVQQTQAGNMLLSLSLPSVCARDLRPGVPKVGRHRHNGGCSKVQLQLCMRVASLTQDQPAVVKVWMPASTLLLRIMMHAGRTLQCERNVLRQGNLPLLHRPASMCPCRRRRWCCPQLRLAPQPTWAPAWQE